MAFGVVGKVAEAIMHGPEGSDYASMSMVGIDPSGGVLEGLEEHIFLYMDVTIE